MNAVREAIDTLEKACEFVDREVDFPLSHTYGGHSSCVELLPAQAPEDEYFVCDMGSGARPFGAHVLARQSGRRATIHIIPLNQSCLAGTTSPSASGSGRQKSVRSPHTGACSRLVPGCVPASRINSGRSSRWAR